MKKLSKAAVMLAALLLAIALAAYPLLLVISGRFRVLEVLYLTDLRIRGPLGSLVTIVVPSPFPAIIWLVLAPGLIGLLLTVFFCWVLACTDTPFRRPLEFLLSAGFLIPSLTFTLAWILLADPSYGLANQLLFKWGLPRLDIYSYAGFVLSHVPLVTSTGILLVTPFLRHVWSGTRASSNTEGTATSPIHPLFNLLPLLLPAVIGSTLAGFLRSWESLEAAQMLGMPARIVYNPPFFGGPLPQPPLPPGYLVAAASSALFVFSVIIILMVNRWLSRSRHNPGTVASPVPPVPLGNWKYVTLAVCVLYLLVFLALPLAIVTLATFMKVPLYFNLPDPYTSAHWTTVLHEPSFASSLARAVFGAIAISLAGFGIYSVAGRVLRKASIRELLRGRSRMIPYLLPFVLLGAAWLAVSFGVHLFTSFVFILDILIIVTVIKELPIGGRPPSSDAGPGEEPGANNRWSPPAHPGLLVTPVILLLTGIRDIAIMISFFKPMGVGTSSFMPPYWERYYAMSPEKTMVMALITMAILVLIALGGAVLRRVDSR